MSSSSLSLTLLMTLTACLACSDGHGPNDAAPEVAPADGGREAPPEAPPDASGPPRLVHPLYSSGTRLKQVQMVGDDGTRRDWSLRDTARDEVCWQMRAEDGKLRCLPMGTTVETAFTDAACTQPVALSFTPCAPKYAGQWLSPPVGDHYRARLRPIGAPVTMATLYVSEIGISGPTCKPTELKSHQRLFTVGEPIDPAAFVAVTEEDKLFGAELPVAGRYHVYEDGARARVALTDSKLGGMCDIYLAPDGTERCYPMGPGAGTFSNYSFADDACSVPLTVPVPTGQVVRFALENAYLGGGARLYRTVGPHQGPVFRGTSTDCRPQTAVFPDLVAYRFSRDDEVPVSTLARVESWPAGGSRLRDGATVIADGAVFPQGRFISALFDPVHDQDCYFSSVGEGGYRCVPLPRTPEDLFGDPTCTKPAFLPDRRFVTGGSAAISEAPVARHIVIKASGDSCGPPSMVYQVGDPAPEQYEKRSTTCQLRSALPGYHLLGPPADLNQFVKGELETR